MSTDQPQAREMEAESMLRTLAAQAEALWPQEQPLLAALGQVAPSVLDVGCGSGEITTRLRRLHGDSAITGVDLFAPHLDIARSQDPSIDYAVADARHLPFADGAFDLVVCRHVLQAVPSAPAVLDELWRVCAPGGWVHMLAEDYGMIHFPGEHLERFWLDGAVAFGKSAGCDLLSGRRVPAWLRGRAEDLRVHYLAVDTLRVPAATFGAIWTAWADGYADGIAAATDLSRAVVDAAWAEMQATIEDPAAYAVWLVPVIQARKPG